MGVGAGEEEEPSKGSCEKGSMVWWCRRRRGSLNGREIGEQETHHQTNKKLLGVG